MGKQKLDNKKVTKPQQVKKQAVKTIQKEKAAPPVKSAVEVFADLLTQGAQKR